MKKYSASVIFEEKQIKSIKSGLTLFTYLIGKIVKKILIFSMGKIVRKLVYSTPEYVCIIVPP